MSDREEMQFRGKLYYLIKCADLRFMCALRNHQSCCLESCKWSEWVPSVRIGFREVRVAISPGDPLRFVLAFGLLIPVLCLDAPGKIAGLLTGFFGRLEGGVFASGCGVESAGWTATESGAIIAEWGVLSRLVSHAKRMRWLRHRDGVGESN